MAFFRQTWTLMSKNLRITVLRQPVTAAMYSMFMPLAITLVLVHAKQLFVPPSDMGLGIARPIRSLPEALDVARRDGKDKVVFVENGMSRDQVGWVVRRLTSTVEAAGMTAVILDSKDDIPAACPADFFGATSCYGAAVFWSSPEAGGSGIWNYTLMVDGALLRDRISLASDENHAEIYVLPFQRHIDSIVTANNSGGYLEQHPLPSEPVNEKVFTNLLRPERDDQDRMAYLSTIMIWLGAAFVVAMIGVSYPLASLMASERETGMTTLLEAMMATRRSWEAQAARLLSYHLTFSMVYTPGWVAVASIVQGLLLRRTHFAMVLFHTLLCGLAMVSLAILGAACFKRAQLSGAFVTIGLFASAIMAQLLPVPNAATVVALSLLLTPCNFVYHLHFIGKTRPDLPPVAGADRFPPPP